MKSPRPTFVALATTNLLLTLAMLGTGGCAAPETPAAGAPGPADTATATRPHAFEKEIAAFEAADKVQSPPRDAMLFVGSSSIRYWTTLAQDFPEIPTIRRGFGGSHLADSLYFADRIILPYKPRVVVVYAGSNDLAAGESRENVLADYQKLAAKIHAGLPAARVVFIAVNPSNARWRDHDNTEKFNRSVAEFTKTAPYLAYLDTYGKMLGADGKPPTELLRADGLHLNAQGYIKWVALLKPDLLKIYRDAVPNS